MQEMAPIPHPDVEAQVEPENRADTIISSLTEIGKIVLTHGTETSYESASGRLDETRRTLDIPLTDGTRLSAIIASPTTERMLSSARISIRLIGQAPQHYIASETTYQTVTLLGKKKWDRYHQFGIAVNKYYHPESKDFEKPLPPETDVEKAAERIFNTKPQYENKDGVDMVRIGAEFPRLGEKTLAFAEKFVTGALTIVREYGQTHPVEETSQRELPAAFSIT